MNHEKFEERLRDIKYAADMFQQKTCNALMNRFFFWLTVVFILAALVH